MAERWKSGLHHPVSVYAKQVTQGRLRDQCCKYEILACQRHLDDLRRQGTDEFPYIFDTTRADRIIRFFSHCIQTRGVEAGQPIQLQPWQVFDLGCKLMLCNQLLRGNAYAWIFRDRATGYPRELIPLPPDHVDPWTDEGGRLWYRFSHPRTGALYDLRPEELLHYKAYSEDGIRGISVLRRAALTLNTAQAAQEYENSIWRSGGQPSGVLYTDSDLGDTIEEVQEDGTVKKVDPKERLRRSWEKVHRGPANAMRLAVLDLGLKYQPISMNNTDAQFVESNEVRVADVCRFFGVPLHLAFAGKQSFESNEQNGIEYVNYTLLGYETQWGQEDSYKLLLPGERDRGLRIKRELKVFLRGDTAAQAALYTSMRNVSAMCPNEIRALEDMGAIPGGDSYYASWNYGPLAQWAELSVLRAMGRAGGAPQEGDEDGDG